jgi:hypothetical protein
MGRTHVPLVIWVDDEWTNHPQVAEWQEKGHDVVPLQDVLAERPAFNPPDIILSRRAWRWDDEQWPHAEVPLKAARKARKTPEKGKAQG